MELLPFLSFMTGVYRPQAALGTIVPDHLVPETGVLVVDCDPPIRTPGQNSWRASSVSSTSSDTKTFLITPITINEELNLSKGKNHKIE